MSVNDPFKIKYGSREVGGTSDIYLLHGPYVIDKSFTTLRLVFDVVVIGSSYSNLQSRADSLETDFRKRDQTLLITLDASVWTYTAGTDILNSTASLAKTGDELTDRGYSRAYTCVIEADLPADDSNTGLRDIEWNVEREPGRQRIVSVRGVYTALSGTAASVKYAAAGGADAEASTFLTALSGSATYELEAETFTPDRNDHLCTFSRQYVELLVNQTQGSLDATNIRDHRVTFTDLSQHPGDSAESIYRLRRVVGTYDCAVDIDQSTDLQAVFDSDIKNHIKELFRTEFTPQIFCIEDRRLSYDETTKRISVSIQFLYQTSGGADIIEVSQSLAFREARNIDYTPVHGGDEFAADADVGWAVLERVATRTVIVIGVEEPARRLGQKPKIGPAGEIEGLEGGPNVVRDGWNIVQNTSQATPQWLGDPDEEQIRVTVLTETVVERFHKLPTGGSGSLV